jgi:anti-anti-sigma regulatory factor
MKVELPAQCLFPEAQLLSRSLLDALKSGESIEIDGHAVTRIGTAALQLLWLARRDVTDQAHEWLWTATSEPLRRAARQLFMTDALGLPHESPPVPATCTPAH